MPTIRSLLKTTALLASAALLAACSSSGADLGEMRPELADFRLCYNIVTTNDAVRGPLSREADIEVFADAIRDEVDRRFGRYQGERLYHIAAHLDAYVLAVPGIPLVASPRSALILSVNVWDDQLGRPLNERPEQLTILESAGASAVVGSGLSMSEDEQMAMLAQNGALAIENWLIQHPEWFEGMQGPMPAETPEAAAATDPAAPVAAPPAAPAAPAATPEGAAPGAEAAGPSCGRR